MKNLLQVFLLILTSCSCSKTINSTKEVSTVRTTYYLIRHAEYVKADTSKNPNLNADGFKRAKAWAKHFKNVKLDAVYSTDYTRTQETAKPTAMSKSFKTISYNPASLYNSNFQTATTGKTVLIVGHSNTTPDFVNKILGEKKYTVIDHNEHSLLYTVTIYGKNKTSTVQKIN